MSRTAWICWSLCLVLAMIHSATFLYINRTFMAQHARLESLERQLVDLRRPGLPTPGLGHTGISSMSPTLGIPTGQHLLHEAGTGTFTITAIGYGGRCLPGRDTPPEGDEQVVSITVRHSGTTNVPVPSVLSWTHD